MIWIPNFLFEVLDIGKLIKIVILGTFVGPHSLYLYLCDQHWFGEIYW